MRCSLLFVVLAAACLTLALRVTARVNHAPSVAGLQHWRSRLASPPVLPGAALLNVTRPEGVRTFYVYASSAYRNATDRAVPLLIAYHGLGDTCDSFLTETGFADYAASAAAPFLLAVPCATSGLIGTAWNAGTCCLQPTKVDDVAFTRAMVAAVKQQGYQYDSANVYASGFSNGAMMAEILGCQASDIFAGVASVSGVVELEPGNDGGLKACDAAFATHSTALRVLHVHGQLDDVVPMDGDALLGFPPIMTDMNRWSARIGCNAVSNQTWTRGDFTSLQWSCAARPGAHVELVVDAKGQHEWPVTHDFDTTLAIVQFLFGNSTAMERRAVGMTTTDAHLPPRQQYRQRRH